MIVVFRPSSRVRVWRGRMEKEGGEGDWERKSGEGGRVEKDEVGGSEKGEEGGDEKGEGGDGDKGEGGDEVSPPKRKKYVTKREVMDKLKKHDQVIKDVCMEICEELCPFDINDEEALQMEDRLERIEKAAKVMTSKVSRLRKEVRERRYRNNDSLLDEQLITCSPFSVLESGEEEEGMKEKDESLEKLDEEEERMEEKDESLDEESEDEQKEEGKSNRPKTYAKKPLNNDMLQITRRTRVKPYRNILEDWAKEEGVSSTQLIGFKVSKKQ